MPEDIARYGRKTQERIVTRTNESARESRTINRVLPSDRDALDSIAHFRAPGTLPRRTYTDTLR